MSFFHLKKLKTTPRQARIYLFFAVLLIAAPTIMYKIVPSQAGKMLVASGVMQGEPFEKTVIYLQSHHGYGAHGFIVNKPMSEADAKSLQFRFPMARRFHYGGPVGEGEVISLLIPDAAQDNGFKILNVGTLSEKDVSAYNDLVTDAQLMRDAIVFSGYAGWSPFQLNREIMRGACNVIPYDPVYLEKRGQRAIWDKAVDKILDEKKDSLDPL